jgi:hypothetical protein
VYLFQPTHLSHVPSNVLYLAAEEPCLFLYHKDDRWIQMFVLLSFYFGHCVFCPLSIYGFWLPIWYPQAPLVCHMQQWFTYIMSDLVVTRRVTIMEQELPTLPEHLSWPRFLSGVRVILSFIVLCSCNLDILFVFVSALSFF